MNSIYNYYRYNLLLVCFLIYISNVVQAQIPKAPVNLPSPNAASLGLYGNVPVSLFTGIPNISIPFYTLKEGSLTLPLSISYHASGVQIDQHPGWTGLGWNLNAGGAITRIVKDLPDDDNERLDSSSPCVNSPNGAGFYFSFCGLNPTDWYTKEYIKTNVCKTFRYRYDTEPDEYNFNFLNYSGSFYLDHNHNWKVKSDTKINISLISSTPLAPLFNPVNCTSENNWGSNGGYIPNYSGFILTVEDGTKFIFGGSTASIEYSINFFEQNKDTWLANSWHITKIIHPNGQEVSFSYDRGELISQMYTSLQTRRQTTVASEKLNYALFFLSAGIIGNNSFMTPTCYSFNTGIPEQGIYGGKLISPVYLKEINGVNTKVKFISSISEELRYDNSIYNTYKQWKINKGNTTGDYFCFMYDNFCRDAGTLGDKIYDKLQWRKLDAIEVISLKSNEPVKQFKLLFNNTVNPTPNERLTLLGFNEVNVKNQQVISHEFSYHDSPSFSLPKYLEGQKDHWGFYNNRPSDLGYFTFNGDVKNYASLREPNAQVLLEGTLKTIKYPTGGITEFEYEPHYYSQEVNPEDRLGNLFNHTTSKLAGGLRIKKISSYDIYTTNNKVVKSYHYIKNYNPTTGLNGISSGILASKAKYYWGGEGAYKTTNEDGSQIYSEEIFSTQSVLPMSENSMGSHIGYSEVVEVITNGDTQQEDTNGTTVYKFTNFDNGYKDEPFLSTLQEAKSPYEPFCSRALERGKMLSKEMYNKAGNPVSKTFYEYGRLSDDFIRVIKASLTLTCSGTDHRIYEGTAYKIYTHQFKLKREETQMYDQLDPSKYTASVTNYDYNSYGQIAQTTQQLSNNQETKVKYRYATDMVYKGPEPGDLVNPISRGIALMASPSINMVGLPLETITIRNNQIVNLDATTYREENSKIVVDKIYSLENQQPISISSYQSFQFGDFAANGNNTPMIIDAKLKAKSFFNNYDNKGNVLNYHQANNFNSSYLWGYNQTLPVAEVKNAENSIFSTMVPSTTSGTITYLYNSTTKQTETNNKTVRFTVAKKGTITLRIGFGGNPTSNTSTPVAKFSYNLTGPISKSGSLCTGANCSPYPESENLIDMPPGEYTLTTLYYDNTASCNINISYTYPILNPSTTGKIEFYYMGFEDDQSAYSSLAHTGERCNNNRNFSVNFTKPNNRSYIISWFEWNGIKWVYNQETYTGNKNFSAAAYIDDIRVYPVDAQMTTYTHNPLIGVTSVSDKNNFTTFYRYDGFGRLEAIVDDKGNIIKKFEYRYANQ